MAPPSSQPHCPITEERVDGNASRTTCLLTITTLVAFAATGWAVLVAALSMDYGVRAFGRSPSPMQRGGARLARALGIPAKPSAAAPKRFAARIGLLFALAATLLAAPLPTAAVAVALSLAFFNVLDGALGFCVGCLTYTSVVLPLRARWGAAG